MRRISAASFIADTLKLVLEDFNGQENYKDCTEKLRLQKKKKTAQAQSCGNTLVDENEDEQTVLNR